MSDWTTTFISFVSIMLVAVFVQNTVFTRALGTSRLIFLVREAPVDSVIFCALLTLVQVLSAPAAYFANRLLKRPEVWFREYIRPLVLVSCAALAFTVVMLFLRLLKSQHSKEITAALPLATFNTAVLGPMLLSGMASFTFVQTIGFALGSGLGYGFAVLLVAEGQRRLNNRSVPVPFKGLPVQLLYIGLLALAMYGLTGHRLGY